MNEDNRDTAPVERTSETQVQGEYQPPHIVRSARFETMAQTCTYGDESCPPPFQQPQS